MCVYVCMCVCVCVCVEWMRLAQKRGLNQFLVNANNQPEVATKSVKCFRDLSKYHLPKRDDAAFSWLLRGNYDPTVFTFLF
jgi:hypothetical protein